MWAGRAEALEQVDGGLVERRGEEGDAQLARLGEQGLVPFERRVRFLVEVVEGAAVPEAALDAEIRPVMVDGEGVGGVGLNLDRVGAGRRRRLEHRQRPLEAAIVVSRQLADDIGLVVAADRTAGDGDGGGHGQLNTPLCGREAPAQSRSGRSLRSIRIV